MGYSSDIDCQRNIPQMAIDTTDIRELMKFAAEEGIVHRQRMHAKVPCEFPDLLACSK
jgi:hypothetical protein